VGEGWKLKEVKSMRKGFSFLVGLFAGALVGGIAGILLAPYSGPELQGQVRTRLQGLIEEGKRAASARRAELENQLEDFKRGTPVTLEAPPEEA
jgi:gas vesicle protein